MKKCPFCAEDIQYAAVVCKHCQRSLVTTRPVVGRGVKIFATVTLGLLGLLVAWVLATGSGDYAAPTMAKFGALQTGMSRSDVERIVGGPGRSVSENEIGGLRTEAFSWQNASGSNMLLMFQNDRLVQKSQFGLK